MKRCEKRKDFVTIGRYAVSDIDDVGFEHD